jgi:hypothetical protein
MTAVLRRLDPWPTLRSSPISLPQLLALLALVTLSAAEGGFPLEHWAPGAVLISLLLVVAIVALPLPDDRRAAGSRVAIVCIAGFAVWTAASLLWSDDKGAAAIASTRTGLLAATFVLFARWRHTPRTAALILTILTAGLGAIAWGVMVELHGATNLDPWFLYDRLLEPIGYVNAGAAFFGVTAFLGLGLLGGALPTPYRLVGALVVVPGAALSLLCLSRGGLLAAAIVVILLLAFLPGRARNATALVIAGIGMLVALSSLLDVGDAVRDNAADATSVLQGAMVKVAVGSVITALLTWVWVAVEGRFPTGNPIRTAASRLGGIAVGVAGLVAVACALANVGPVTVDSIRDGARSITRPYSEQPASESRLTAGLNSGRWDFWTVAWHQFEKAPILGAGADNFREDYLQAGRSPENPRYAHSLWLRSLGELGIVGTLLLLGWVLMVAVSVRRLAAGSDPVGRAVAVAGGGAFGMWVVHGSGDWLLEYGGLSAIVAAVAGLVVASSPDWRARGRATSDDKPPRRTKLPMPRLGARIGVVLLVVSAVWSATQWIADRDRTSAAILAADQPRRAIDRAETANSLEPFGEQAEMLLGSLAVQRRDFVGARDWYLKAYERNPRAARPRMWVGVLESASGDNREARRWLKRAARVAPRDQTIALLLEQVIAGTQLSPVGVQSQLADLSAGLVRDPDPVAPSSPPAASVTPPAAAG